MVSENKKRKYETPPPSPPQEQELSPIRFTSTPTPSLEDGDGSYFDFPDVHDRDNGLMLFPVSGTTETFLFENYQPPPLKRKPLIITYNLTRKTLEDALKSERPIQIVTKII